MTEFGERQGYAEGQRPAQAEQMRKGSDKPLPVARHQKHPEGQQQRQGVTQQTGAITSEPGPGTIEKRIRPPQRNAEKQVLVQQAFPEALTLRRRLAGKTAALLRILGDDQVVAAQKTQHLFDVRLAQWLTGLSIRGA